MNRYKVFVSIFIGESNALFEFYHKNFIAIEILSMRGAA